MSFLSNLSNKKLAYLCFRISIGLAMFVHGAIRLPKLSQFANGMAETFSGSIVAGFPALSMAYLIPIAEVATGLLILIGGKAVRWGLALGILTMGLLMVGTCLIEKWEILPSQLLHAVAFYLLLINPNTEEGK